MSTVLNGRRRPSLNDQIDRFDRILDGLADGLNDAVATAVRDAIREATETILHEVLARGAITPASSPVVRPTLGERIRNFLGQARARLATLFAPTVAVAVTTWSGSATTRQRVRRFASSMTRRLYRVSIARVFGAIGLAASTVLVLWRTRQYLIRASGVGLVVAITSYVAGPTISSALCGLASAGLTFVTSAGLRALRWAGVRARFA